MRSTEMLRIVRSFRTPAMMRGLLLGACLALPVMQSPQIAQTLDFDSYVMDWLSPLLLSMAFSVANAILVNMQVRPISRDLPTISRDLPRHLPRRHPCLILADVQAALEDPFDGDCVDDIMMQLFTPNWAFWAELAVDSRAELDRAQQLHEQLASAVERAARALSPSALAERAPPAAPPAPPAESGVSELMSEMSEPQPWPRQRGLGPRTLPVFPQRTPPRQPRGNAKAESPVLR